MSWLFSFNKNQRIGIFTLILLIVLMQIGYFFVDFRGEKPISSQNDLSQLRKEIDSLRNMALMPKKDTIYPFNPNYLSDYKGFMLGMKVDEIDRLLAFRKEGKFVNSAQEFQQITQISDTLLNQISPYFKFPDWVTKRKSEVYKTTLQPQKSKTLIKTDINSASKEDLMKIRGIGDKLSDRILKYRQKLGGFVQMSQLEEVYGLEKEVIIRIMDFFDVKSIPDIPKKNINDLSVYELSKIPYIKYEQAKKIVAFRSQIGGFQNFEQLLQISDFDEEFVKKIQIYLFVAN